VKMSRPNFTWSIFTLTIWLWLLPAHGSPPNLQEVGRILGFPSSELIIENVTAKEKEIYWIPTNREKRSGDGVKMIPEKLSEVYRITGKTPSSFYPVLISIADEGMFLSKNIQEFLSALASLPDASLAKGGRGPYGPLAIEGKGSGGIYLGKIRVPSRIKEMTEPQEKTAMISELRIPSQKIDIRIAFMAALDEGAVLTSIPGGERYFESFSSREESIETPNYNVSALFEALNSEVLKTANAQNRSTQTESFATKPQNYPSVTQPSRLENEHSDTTVLKPIAPRKWWWAGGVLLVVIALVLVKKCRS